MSHNVRVCCLVSEMPRCDERQVLREGDKTTLTCQLGYSGSSQPRIRWFREEEIESEDLFEIRLARRSVKLVASPSDDRQTYSCHVAYDKQLIEECQVFMDVTCKGIIS